MMNKHPRANAAVGEAFRPPATPSRLEPRPTVGEAFRPPAATIRPALRPVRKVNRLPLENYREPGAYSLTLVTNQRSKAFSDESVILRCLEVLREEAVSHGFQVFAYCFMPDHLHVLIGSEDGADAIRFVKAFKQKTGHWYKSRVPAGGLEASPAGATALWQRSFHDHVVRSEESLRALAEYVLDNPVIAGLAQERGQYPWAGSFVWDDLF